MPRPDQFVLVSIVARALLRKMLPESPRFRNWQFAAVLVSQIGDPVW
jgi:hypothetical protein